MFSSLHPHPYTALTSTTPPPSVHSLHVHTHPPIRSRTHRPLHTTCARTSHVLIDSLSYTLALLDNTQTTVTRAACVSRRERESDPLSSDLKVSRQPAAPAAPLAFLSILCGLILFFFFLKVRTRAAVLIVSV